VCIWVSELDGRLLAAHAADAATKPVTVHAHAKAAAAEARDEGRPVPFDTPGGKGTAVRVAGPDGSVAVFGVIAERDAAGCIGAPAFLALASMAYTIVRLDTEAGRFRARSRQLIAEEQTLERAYAQTMSEALAEREQRLQEQRQYASRLEKEVAERSVDLREAVGLQGEAGAVDLQRAVVTVRQIPLMVVRQTQPWQKAPSGR